MDSYSWIKTGFQLILNPIRDWNIGRNLIVASATIQFQLILNPIRDWNIKEAIEPAIEDCSN